MNKTFAIVILLLLCQSLHSQDNSKGWIYDWEKATVSIGEIDTIVKGNNKIPYFNVMGTGVFFYINYENSIIPILVTARHVFEEPKKNWHPQRIWIRYSWFEDRPLDKYFGIELKLRNDNNKLWFSHPDSTVDLACLFALNIPDSTFIGNDNGKPIIPYNDIADETDIFEGEAILVLGYPGVVGPLFNTKALVRQGIIAWASDKKNSVSKVLIDCNIFPGNSGGPVFSYPTGINKIGEYIPEGKAKFLGIVTQTLFQPTVVVSSKSDKPITDKDGNAVLSMESTGIGVIEPAARVRELLNFVKKEISK